MKLERAQELYTDYLEGTLSPAMRLALEQHFDSETGARDDYDQFAMIGSLLSRPVIEIDPPVDFRAKIMERASMEYGRRQQKPSFWQSITQTLFPEQQRPLAGAFAAVLVLVAVGAVLFRPESGKTGVAGFGIATFTAPSVAYQSTMRGVETAQGNDGYLYHLIDLHLPSSVSRASVQAWVFTSDDQIVDPNARAEAATSALPSGQILTNDEHLKIPVAFTHAVNQGSTLNVMLRWKAMDSAQQGAEVVFTPVDPGDGMSPQQAVQAVQDNANFYDLLQSIASGYHATVIVDAATAPTQPANAWTSDQTPELALKTVAGSVGYTVDVLPGNTFVVHPKTD